MTDKRVDQLPPPIRLRVRSQPMPVKDAVLAGCKGLWSETQFDEWPDVACQQIVVELVDPGPGVDRLAVFDSYRSEYVVEDRVKPDIAEAKFVGHQFELGLAFVANQRPRVI